MENFDREETPVESELHQQPRCGKMPNVKGATYASDGSGYASEGRTNASDGVAPTRVDDTQLLRDIRILLRKQREEVIVHVDRCFKHQGQVVEALLLQRSSSNHSAKAGSHQGFGQPSSILRHEASEDVDGIKGYERSDTRFADDLETVKLYQDTTTYEMNDMLGRFSVDESSGAKAIGKRASLETDAESDTEPSEWNQNCMQSNIFDVEPEPLIQERGSMQSYKGEQSFRDARSVRATQRRMTNMDLQLKEAAAKQDEPLSPVVEDQADLTRAQYVWWKFRFKVQAFVRHSAFETFSFIIIFTNVAIVGVEVDYMATSHERDTPQAFFTIDFVYTLLFLFELVCRMIAEEPSFFYSKNWAWNYFDLMIVASSVVEQIFALLQSTGGMDVSHFRVIRVIRVTRLIRTFRMVRIVRFIRALRTLLYSIMATMKSLVWALLLLLMIFYGFGVAFTQAASEYNLGTRDLPDIGDADCGLDAMFCSLLTFWGTLPRSMFTLFKAIAGGVSWHSVVEPLGLVGWVWVAVFVGFIAFTFLAVLNVVTGVFCQSAIESAQQDKDIATMQLMASRGAFIETVKKLFVDIDTDLSGAISIREFEQFVENERVQAYFSSLEIDTSDIWSLFKLMDSDRTGNIDLEEFIGGCLQLRGQAKAIQIAKMSYDNSLMRKMLVEFMDAVDDSLDRLLVWAGIDLDLPEEPEEEDGQIGLRPSDGAGPESSQATASHITSSHGMRGSFTQTKSTKSDRAAKQTPFRRAFTRTPDMIAHASGTSATVPNSQRNSASSGRSSRNSGLFLQYANVRSEEDKRALARLEKRDVNGMFASDEKFAYL